MNEHLKKHPHDWQTVVSVFLNNSHSVEFDRKLKYNQAQSEISKFRR